jgi:putative transposase
MSTYSKIYIHTVFAVKYRNPLITPDWEERLFKYTTGIVQQKEQKMLAINGMPDHIHILIGMKPNCCLSDLIREVKKSTTDFANNEKFSKFKFQWQEGYAAFSCGYSQLDREIGYIANQKEHHKKLGFAEEYINFLNEYAVEYQEKYLF